MQRKHWLIVSLVFLSSCGSGPKLKICVSDPAVHGFDCYDEKSNQNSFIPYTASDKYIALDPADAQTLFSWCAGGKP